jgi:hypothetical protein
MNSFITPMLANGMIMIWVEMLWSATAIVAGIVALVALVLGISSRAGQGLRRFAVVALVLSFIPFLVLLGYSGPISSYASARAPIYMLLSVVPLVLSALAMWLTRRTPPGDSQP